MNNYFKISEFVIDPLAEDLPIHVANKILAHHLPILNDIRHRLGVPVIISKHSGYRPIEWEYAHGRSGQSQHTFRDLGAVDVRSNRKFDALRQQLIASNYSRVCFYPHHGFIHCDFASDKKQYFEANAQGNWQFKHFRD